MRPVPGREYLLGDWGGTRSGLAARGIVFNLTYASDVFGVASGGLRRGVFYNGLLDTGLDADLGMAFGWEGTRFHVNALHPHGPNGSARYVGDLGTVSNIEAYDSFRLYEAWLQQELGDGRFSLRAGQITFDSEFAVLDAYGGLFIQSGFGAPEALAANLPVPIYPYAAPGARFRVTPTDRFSIQAAVFDGNPAPGRLGDRTPGSIHAFETNPHGVSWAVRRSEGLLVAGEISYRVNRVPAEELSPTRTTADDRPPGEPAVPARPSTGLASSYEAGAILHTDRFADVYGHALVDLGSVLAPGAPENRGRNFGFYLNLEQEVWREPGTESQGLGLFAHGIWMPPDRNPVMYSVEGGLHYRGALPGRDDDAIGMGVAVLRVSPDVADAVRAANLADGAGRSVPGHELTLEWVYRWQVSRWLWIQPHVQYVFQPGGTRDVGNALVVGIRLNWAM